MYLLERLREMKSNSQDKRTSSQKVLHEMVKADNRNVGMNCKVSRLKIGFLIAKIT